MKFVHAADLHIDSPLVGLQRYEGAPVEQIREATRRAFVALVSTCLSESVQALVLAGDLFDGEWRDYSTGLFFVRQLQRLKQAGIAVLIVKGNHDAQSQISQRLTLPDNTREFSAERPETVIYEQWGVAFHGQSYGHRAEHRDLAAGYPAAVPGLINVGVLHTSATGRPGHETYAPCKVETLVAKGYDYWALGHVHEREVLSTNPWIVFPGNLQGRHIKETGPKGATFVDCHAGAIRAVEHRVFDVVRFVRLTVNASVHPTPEEVVDGVFDAVERSWQAAEGRVLVARVSVEGQTPAHLALHRETERWTAEVRSRVNELPGVWVEQVKFDTRAEHAPHELDKRADALGQLFQSIDAYRHDPQQRAELLSSFEELKSKLPPEVRRGAAGLNLDDPDALLEILTDVAELFEAKLYDRGQS